MRQAVRPIGKFLIGALAAIADQGDAIAKTFFDNAVGQLDGRVKILGIAELRPLQNEIRPWLFGKISPREIVEMAGGPEILMMT